MIDLKAAPFHLDDDAIEWVTSTLKALTKNEKIGQLFVPVGLNSDHQELSSMIERIKPAGMMFRSGPSEEVQEVHRCIQNASDIPLLISSNLEVGGSGSSISGTVVGSQMQIAATGNTEHASNLGHVCAVEGAALGVNWSFSPIIDLDINPHNPITNIRTFGADVSLAADLTRAHITSMQKQGMAAAAKHFPGDGTDARDQHITFTYNDLSCEEWDQSFGKMYEAAIESGVLSVMAGHIAQPAYSRAFNPELKDEEIMPATLAPELLQGLLRDKLGFNGVIVTDATPMLGFSTAMPRAEAVPKAIESGCDLFLFNKDLDEDFQFMLEGLETGLLTEARLDEAVTRTLAMKAALGLHKKAKDQLVPSAEALEVVGCDVHKQLAKFCADSSVTLVKNRQQFVPVNPADKPRVLLFELSDGKDIFGQGSSVFDKAKTKLEQAGFELTEFDPAKFRTRDTKLSVNSITENYDFALYLSNLKPASNKTDLRLHWLRPMGADAPWFTQELPAVFISFGSPYHLYDVPRIPAMINAYSDHDQVVDVAIDALVGKAPFAGTSPVDPFLGLWDTRL